MKIDFDFFKIKSKLLPQKGRIIVSEPFLPGNYFSRSTILLVEYHAKGAVGFILNKPFQTGVKELFSDFPDFDAEVYLGGPVSDNNLYYIHTLGEQLKGSIQVKDELYWGGDFDQLKLLLLSGKVTSNQIRFFIGYSGWSAGQLDAEIAENSWLTIESDIKKIMESDQDFWIESVKNAGAHYSTWKNFPEDPNSN